MKVLLKQVQLVRDAEKDAGMDTMLLALHCPSLTTEISSLKELAKKYL